MQRIIPYLVVAGILLAGCDDLFIRRIEITDTEARSLTVAGPASALLISTVRHYAYQHNLACEQATELSIECYRQPVRVWAVSTDKGAVVCYMAMGIPFESGKFRARMDELQNSLVEKFGAAAVTSRVARCAPPPSASHHGA